MPAARACRSSPAMVLSAGRQASSPSPAASARDAESDRIYSSVDSLVAGEYTVKAEYAGKTATVTVKVVNNVV